MHKRSRTFIARAALAGLVAGAAHSQAALWSGASFSPEWKPDCGLLAAAADVGKHDCKGMNSCKGQGGCMTSDNGCKGKNSCRSKGGCSTKSG